MSNLNIPGAGAIPPPGEDVGLINIPVGSVPNVMRDAEHPDMTQRHAVKINGQDLTMTTAELIASAQKVEASQQNFQAAAEKEKSLEAMRIRDADMQTFLRDNDPEAFRRMAAGYNIPGDRVETIIQEMDLEGNDEWDDEDVDGGGDLREAFQEAFPNQAPSKPSTPPQVGYDQLSPDLQRALRIVETDRISGIVQKALDSDEVMSYNMKRYSQEDQVVIRKELDEKIRGRLPQYGGDFGDGKQILQEVMPDFRRLFEVLAKPDRTTGQIGIGPSPGGESGIAHPSKEPAYVSSSDAAFDQHITEVMAHNMTKADDAR